jgi:hypothetical protein
VSEQLSPEDLRALMNHFFSDLLTAVIPRTPWHAATKYRRCHHSFWGAP